MTRARVAAAVAVLAAAQPALAFQRSTDACTQVCLYWPTRSLTYVVNEQGSQSVPACNTAAPGDVNGPWRTVVDASFAQWTSVNESGTDLAITDAGTTANTAIGWSSSGPNQNLVVFRHGPCTQVKPDNGMSDRTNPCWKNFTCGNLYNCWEDNSPVDLAIIGLTTVTYDPSTGVVHDADMELNDWDGTSGSLPQTGATLPTDGWYLTCTAGLSSLCGAYGAPAGCIYMDLQNTVTHEAGHFIGLAHPTSCPSLPGGTCSSATMFASASLGEITKRTLSLDDVQALETVYPAAAATPTCAAQNVDKCLGKSGCGCGTGAGPLAALALLGVLLAAPRRHRRRLE